MARLKYGTYHCDECDLTFKSFREVDGPLPDCPICVPDNTPFEAKAPAIIGNKAKAIDMAQKIAEEDFGLTDMRDNNRPGDVIVKSPSPIQTAESEQITREMMAVTNAGPEVAPHLQQYVKNFFGAANQGQTTIDPAASIQGAAPAAQAARSEGVDPIALLHKSKGLNSGINRLNVIAKAKAQS
jgi:hypothetical protein